MMTISLGIIILIILIVNAIKFVIRMAGQLSCDYKRFVCNEMNKDEEKDFCERYFVLRIFSDWLKHK